MSSLLKLKPLIYEFDTEKSCRIQPLVNPKS